MILVKLEGGLGNQMFQYSLGRHLSIKQKTGLLLDTSLYAENVALKNRPYGLSHFTVAGRVATPEEIKKMRYPYGVPFYKLQKKFERKILKRNTIKFDPRMLQKKGTVVLDGFWQSDKYFKDIRSTLLSDFKLKEPMTPGAKAIADTITNTPQSVSLHVRRGDYAESKKNIEIYGNHCNQTYYKKALEYIAKFSPQMHVFVFSDDIEWVKNNLDIPFQKTYIPEAGGYDFERMILMSLCSNHIIANSTFGWWGAWLNEKKDKIVVAPSIWTPGIDLPIDDILPSEWVKIDSI